MTTSKTLQPVSSFISASSEQSLARTKFTITTTSKTLRTPSPFKSPDKSGFVSKIETVKSSIAASIIEPPVPESPEFWTSSAINLN